jgi:hypothetical protein
MNANVLPRSELIGSAAQATPVPQAGIYRQPQDWNPKSFAREQIRSLVRRVFFTASAQPVKHVVFCAAEPHTDVGPLCDQVGRALALETSAEIAIVSLNSAGPETLQAPTHRVFPAGTEIKSWSTQIGTNLWRVPQSGWREFQQDSGTGRCWISRLAELQSNFEYVVIHGPAAGMSSETAVLGQLADGIILVLEAHSTRRATARKIIETLESSHSRILGTVLSERKFPVPERLYRRL